MTIAVSFFLASAAFGATPLTGAKRGSYSESVTLGRDRTGAETKDSTVTPVYYVARASVSGTGVVPLVAAGATAAALVLTASTPSAGSRTITNMIPVGPGTDVHQASAAEWTIEFESADAYTVT